MDVEGEGAFCLFPLRVDKLCAGESVALGVREACIKSSCTCFFQMACTEVFGCMSSSGVRWLSRRYVITLVIAVKLFNVQNRVSLHKSNTQQPLTDREDSAYRAMTT